MSGLIDRCDEKVPDDIFQGFLAQGSAKYGVKMRLKNSSYFVTSPKMS